MNQNYLKKYLDVKVYGDNTIIKYYSDNNLSLTYEHSIGLDKVSKDLVNDLIMNHWIDGVIYVLQKISLTERVPTFIYLYTEKYSSVFEKFLKDKKTYSQFYIEPIENIASIRVIINKINYFNINSFLDKSKSELKQNNLEKNKNNLGIESKNYERYTKAISKFKI